MNDLNKAALDQAYCAALAKDYDILLDSIKGTPPVVPVVPVAPVPHTLPDQQTTSNFYTNSPTVVTAPATAQKCTTRNLFTNSTPDKAFSYTDDEAVCAGPTKADPAKLAEAKKLHDEKVKYAQDIFATCAKAHDEAYCAAKEVLK